jgi:hypothetical protein
MKRTSHAHNKWAGEGVKGIYLNQHIPAGLPATSIETQANTPNIRGSQVPH